MTDATPGLTLDSAITDLPGFADTELCDRLLRSDVGTLVDLYLMWDELPDLGFSESELVMIYAVLVLARQAGVGVRIPDTITEDTFADDLPWGLDGIEGLRVAAILHKKPSVTVYSLETRSDADLEAELDLEVDDVASVGRVLSRVGRRRRVAD
jgi:hypothetical protein